MGDQFPRDRWEIDQSHEENNRFRRADLAPVDCLHVVPGHEGHRGRVFAVRERNSGVRGQTQRSGYAWHDFERKARWTIGFRVEKMRQLTFRDPSRAAHLCNGGWLFEPVLDGRDANLIAITVT